jgi:protein Hikeshi
MMIIDLFSLFSIETESTIVSPTPSLFSAFQHQTSIPTDGLLGISIELLSQLEQQVQPSTVTPSTIASNVEFVSKMLENFVNYAMSFVQTVPGSSVQIVPLNVIQTWYHNFQRRIADNPNFWKQRN